MKRVNMKDAFEFAIKLETKGQSFFKHCAEHAKREDVQKMFSYLGAEESAHITTLKELFNKIDKDNSNPITRNFASSKSKWKK